MTSSYQVGTIISLSGFELGKMNHSFTPVEITKCILFDGIDKCYTELLNIDHRNDDGLTGMWIKLDDGELEEEVFVDVGSKGDNHRLMRSWMYNEYTNLTYTGYLVDRIRDYLYRMLKYFIHDSLSYFHDGFEGLRINDLHLKFSVVTIHHRLIIVKMCSEVDKNEPNVFAL